MKIYTKTGDKGSTSLVDGSRIRKSALRIEALGTFDEANAHLGLLATIISTDHPAHGLLFRAQAMLFTCGSRLADPAQESRLALTLPDQSFIQLYEQSIDTMTRDMPPLTQFIVSGGSIDSSQAHIARAVVRRCERILISLVDEGIDVEPVVLRWINRLSDWLFTLARYRNFEQGISDVVWESGS